MVNNIKMLLLAVLALLSATGCNYEDVPQAHRGRVFEKAWFGESRGFIGDILAPGTHNIGLANELHLMQCGENTVRESFTAPSKNGVVFGADVYVRFQPNCEDGKSIKWVLDNVRPGSYTSDAPKQTPKEETDPQKEVAQYSDKTVTAAQLFSTYVRPALGMAVRDAISAYQSDEINLKRQEIATAIDTGLRDRLSQSAEKIEILKISQVDLSAIVFPEAMKGTMEQLANVKTEVELEKERTKKIEQQILAEQKNKELAKVKAQKSSTEIEEIGRAVRENPEYLTYVRLNAEAEMVQGIPKALEFLGEPNSTLVIGDQALGSLLNPISNKK